MIICGNCLSHMVTMEPNSVDAIVTDPPYGLSFMGKEWDKLWRNKTGADIAYVERTHGEPTSRARKLPDYSAANFRQMQDWHYAWAVAALRVAKPGCHLLAFGGTRTFHRLTCAIEDAGWEIQNCLGWIYGSGFPKNHRPSLDYERTLCEKRNGKWFYLTDGEPMRQQAPFRSEEANEWQGWGTALKPAWEPIILVRKPLDGTVAANVQKWGAGAVNVDGCRIDAQPWTRDNTRGKAEMYDGRGMKPNVKVGNKGRWPANIIHDGSDEALELFPQAKGNYATSGESKDGQIFGYGNDRGDEPRGFGDSGSAARFFYCAKASRREREAGLEGMPEKQVDMTRLDPEAIGCNNPHNRGGRTAANHHPTVKPVALMRYLCRLVTPPNGLILDPFCGSGTTGIAAKAEGFRFIGIDNNAEYCEIAERRVNAAL